MTIHTIIVGKEEFAGWDGNPAIRFDLRSKKNKNPKKTAADYHLYAPVDSELAGAVLGSPVHLHAPRPPKK